MQTISPAFILVEPQLGENIGKAARAMLNFSQQDMRLVAPRDGWPNPDAGPAASGADTVLDAACVYDMTRDALADCAVTFATTVRPRGMKMPVITPRDAAMMMQDRMTRGERPAILFGREASGLSNDDVALADYIITAPVNPDFGSLNLAQAVVLVAYELFQLDPPNVSDKTEPQATKAELLGFFDQLHEALDARGFYRSEDRRHTQQRALLTLLQSGGYSSQQVQTWRGILKTLDRPRDEWR